MFAVGTKETFEVKRNMAASPEFSDVHLFGDLKGVIDLDSKVSNGALDLGMV